MLMQAHVLCHYLDWDSSFFDRRIARVTESRLTEEAVRSITVWCEQNAIDCIYFLASSDDADTIRLLEDHRFRFVDVRLTLETRPAVSQRMDAGEGLARFCEPADVPALREMARVNHWDSRFYYDDNFDKSRCDALYEVWIEKSCHGYADSVIVAEIGERVVGYITCHLRDYTKRGEIGLLGVASESQGKGIGKKLVNASLRWFAEQQIDQVSVVTQGRNINAQRLYQKCGFITQSLQLWYHKWF